MPPEPVRRQTPRQGAQRTEGVRASPGHGRVAEQALGCSKPEYSIRLGSEIVILPRGDFIVLDHLGLTLLPLEERVDRGRPTALAGPVPGVPDFLPAHTLNAPIPSVKGENGSLIVLGGVRHHRYGAAFVFMGVLQTLDPKEAGTLYSFHVVSRPRFRTRSGCLANP